MNPIIDVIAVCSLFAKGDDSNILVRFVFPFIDVILSDIVVDLFGCNCTEDTDRFVVTRMNSQIINRNEYFCSKDGKSLVVTPSCSDDSADGDRRIMVFVPMEEITHDSAVIIKEHLLLPENERRLIRISEDNLI